MRSLFIVLAKLFGVYQLVAVSLAIPQLLVMVITYFFQGENAPDPFEPRFMMAIMILYYLVMTALLAVLTFRTEKVADWLRIPTDSASNLPERESFLAIGIQLIAIFFLVSTVPTMVAQILVPEGQFLWRPSLPPGDDLTSNGLTIVAATLLLVRTRPLSRLLARATQDGEPPAAERQ